MFHNYLKTALRVFLRHRLASLISVLSLTIGVSSAIVIFLVVSFDFSFDKFYPGADRIYRVVTDFEISGNKYFIGGVPGAMPDAVKSRVAGISSCAPFFILDQFTAGHAGAIVPNGSAAPVRFKYKEDMVLADQRYFDIFPSHWLAGGASALSEPFHVALASSKAKKYFPGISYEQMLGKIVIYGDSIRTKVVGIFEEHTKNTDFNFTDFISYSTEAGIQALNINLNLSDWGSLTPSSQFFVKLQPNVSTVSVENQLNRLTANSAAQQLRKAGNVQTYRLQRLSDLHFDEHYASFYERTASRTTLYGVMGIGAFLLLLGCINFINLTTARSGERAKEIGIRKTMGSHWSQLMLQFLSETFLITLIAIAISCLIASPLLKLFSPYVPDGIKLDFLHQPVIVLFLLVLCVLVSLLSGLYPALVLANSEPISSLKNIARSKNGTSRNVRLRKTLTVAQFAISQFLLIATVCVSKQIYYAMHKDLGFRKNAIVTVSTPWNSRDLGLKRVFLNAVNSLSQVERVSLGGASPSSDNTHSSQVSCFRGKTEMQTEVEERFGDGDYIRVYQIRLLAGRDIEASDSSKAFLINVACARAMGFSSPESAVGQFLEYDGKKMLVVGLISNFYYRSLRSPIKPLVILNRSDNSYFSGTLHIAFRPQLDPGQWKTAIDSIRSIWERLYPNNDFDFRFFDESIADYYQNDQKTSHLLGWAMGLSVLISCLGIFGLAVYSCNQRTKEIGIRKTLGASVIQIMSLLSVETIWLILLASLLVGPMAWWAVHRWMEDFTDRTLINWWIYALSAIAMLLIALLTSCLQTIRAARANPIQSLRVE